MAHCSVGLNVNKEYLNTNFDGYKLSLNSIPVYKKRLEFGKYTYFRSLFSHSLTVRLYNVAQQVDLGIIFTPLYVFFD